MKNIVIICISLFLFFIPSVLWNNVYNIGGDDTKLYYLFPEEYLRNFTFNIISDNTLSGASTGYDSPAYHAPFLLFILLVKQLHVLTPQVIMYGLNLAAGFLFFYLFLGLFIRTKSKESWICKILASLLYIFSLYSLNTLFIHQLIAIYLLSVIPCLLYLFVKGVRGHKYHLASLSSLILSVFCPLIVTLPWLSATVIALSPLILYEAYRNKKNFFVYTGVFVCSFALLNSYWMFHFINASLDHSGIGTNTSIYTSSVFLEENTRIIKGVAGIYSPLNHIFNNFDASFPKQFIQIATFNIIFLGIILLAGYLYTKLSKTIKREYVSGVCCLLLSLFFVSPNFGNWSVNLFLFMNNHIPFFSMFRNMYDKFSLAVAFSYAFLFGISLVFIVSLIKNKIYRILLYGLVVILIGNNAYSFWKDNFTQKQIVTQSSGMLNKDFISLVDYLKNQENSSRALWLPMNSPTYVYISDEKLKEHYYSGSSPLRILANRSDYSGRFSFITQNDIFFGDKIFELITQKKYDEVGKIYQKMNAKYIIVDRQTVPVSLSEWYYSFLGVDMSQAQGEQYKSAILGRKIRDFGQTYTLYEINEKYFTDKIYLTNDFSTFPKNNNTLSYKKLSSSDYTIAIKNLEDNTKLVFLDPYNRKWLLALHAPDRNYQLAAGENVVVHGYANGWKLDSSMIKKQFPSNSYSTNSDGSINLTFILHFQPKDYDILIYPLSITVFLVIPLWEIYIFIIYLLTVRNKSKAHHI